jgi:SAM-dependent methyltransferase
MASLPTPHDDAGSIRQWYQDRIKLYGITFESLSAGPLQRERIRHSLHASAMIGPNPAVLDIGCGIGRFYGFLKETGQPCRYTGYDLVPEYLSRCRELYPEITVRERNIPLEPIEGEFDTIVASQVFNHPYSHAPNLEVLQSVLVAAFRACRCSVSIDMLSTYVDYQESHLYYYRPEQVFSMAKAITRRVLLRHDFAPFEFCIQLYK